MAYGIIPTCRYGHGQLVLQKDPQVPNHDGGFMGMTTSKDTVIPGRGFILQIWQCVQCSYLELHDHDLPKER